MMMSARLSIGMTYNKALAHLVKDLQFSVLSLATNQIAALVSVDFFPQ